MGIRLDRRLDGGVVAGLLEEGWQTVASKRALAEFEGRALVYAAAGR